MADTQQQQPRSLVVLSTDGTDRAKLKRQIAFWGIVAVGLGVVIGRWSKKR